MGRVNRRRPSGTAVAPWAGLVGALLLVTIAAALPTLVGWEVYTRTDPELYHSIDPLHALWEPKWFGPGTIPAVLLAGLALVLAARLAERLPWPALLAGTFVAGAAWMLALATVDGRDGLGGRLLEPVEYLQTAQEMDDVPAALDEWVSRIPIDAEDNWKVHVAGHPPLATLFFVLLVRLGLGDQQIALVVVGLAATIAPAVLVTLRALGAEAAGRRAAPFLAFTPAAVFLAVSGDAVFTTAAAWGIAFLALAATASSTRRMLGCSVVSGLLLGTLVMMSYGMPLLGVLAVAVLVAARSWRPLPVVALVALAVVLVLVPFGFSWWEAFPVLRERYYDGIASDRPGEYWTWANLACLLLAAGPVLGSGVAVLLTRLRQVRGGPDRVPVLLAGAGVLMVVLATLSQMSRAETERIWLPFMPWLTVSLVLLPDRWLRPALALQLVTAVLVEHLLYLSW